MTRALALGALAALLVACNDAPSSAGPVSPTAHCVGDARAEYLFNHDYDAAQRSYQRCLRRPTYTIAVP